MHIETRALLLWLLVIVATLSGSTIIAQEKSASSRVYVGTYTRGTSKGIYCLDFDPKTGKLSSAPKLAAEVASPSFLALHPGSQFLYCVNEVDKFDKFPTGSVSAFAVDADSGKLTLLNRQSSGGTGPCHVAVDQTGRCVLVANYGGGSVACLPILKDGSLGPAASFHQHKGSSINKSRQEGPHAHCVVVSGDNRLVVAADLGLDKLLLYRLDPGRAVLQASVPPFAATPPGGGPRHFAFHPRLPFAYANNEITSSVSTYAFDTNKGSLKELQTISTLPGPVKGNSTAETVIHPSGKFLYVSNRGHDSIAMFAIDADKGTLTAIGHELTRGKTPRNFAIDPSGQYLLAANENSDTIAVFRIDAASGRLHYTDQLITVPTPVCVVFLAQ